MHKKAELKKETHQNNEAMGLKEKVGQKSKHHQKEHDRKHKKK